MSKEKNEEMAFICPVGRFFMGLERSAEKKSAVFKHFRMSRVEFLKGLRTLLDERIEDLEKEGPVKSKRATRIKVE